MKSRMTLFTLAVCLFSSFAMADNPSDAPLVADDAGAVAVQREVRAASMKEHRGKKEAYSEKKMADGAGGAAKKAGKPCESPVKAGTNSGL